MINEDLDNFLLPILEKIAEEDLPEIWKNAKYLQQRMIQIDKRGSVGEYLIMNMKIEKLQLSKK